jgi:hypothetical protein
VTWYRAVAIVDEIWTLRERTAVLPLLINYLLKIELAGKKSILGEKCIL